MILNTDHIIKIEYKDNTEVNIKEPFLSYCSIVTTKSIYVLFFVTVSGASDVINFILIYRKNKFINLSGFNFTMETL